MQFILSHWHCVLPALGIVAALFLMREKPKEKKEQQDHTALSQKNNRE